MKTKLVYVLSCVPEKYYIEQALMATYSARHYNPDAEIVLIVDDKTNALLVGKRSELLNYVSDRIVIPFPEECPPMYKSRWMKTSVRELVSGDFLFIDCDTITAQSISDIDSCSYDVGAVLDSHLPTNEYCDALYDSAKQRVGKLGIDIKNEPFYFSSGVIYAKDTEKVRKLFGLWHEYWLEGTKNGTSIDQPSLLKADIDMGHIIQRIPDTFNCVLYTEPQFVETARILHFAAYRNPSWLFSERVLHHIKENGIEPWLSELILSPMRTQLPFRSVICTDGIRKTFNRIKALAKDSAVYSIKVDKLFSDFSPTSRSRKLGKECFVHRHFSIGALLCILPTWISIRLSHHKKPATNICAR